MFVPATSSTIAFNFLIAGELPRTKPLLLACAERSVSNELMIVDRRKANLLPVRPLFVDRLESTKVCDYSEYHEQAAADHSPAPCLVSQFCSKKFQNFRLFPPSGRLRGHAATSLPLEANRNA